MGRRIASQPKTRDLSDAQIRKVWEVQGGSSCRAGYYPRNEIYEFMPLPLTEDGGLDIEKAKEEAREAARELCKSGLSASVISRDERLRVQVSSVSRSDALKIHLMATQEMAKRLRSWPRSDTVASYTKTIEAVRFYGHESSGSATIFCEDEKLLHPDVVEQISSKFNFKQISGIASMSDIKDVSLGGVLKLLKDHGKFGFEIDSSFSFGTESCLSSSPGTNLGFMHYDSYSGSATLTFTGSKISDLFVSALRKEALNISIKDPKEIPGLAEALIGLGLDTSDFVETEVAMVEPTQLLDIYAATKRALRLR